MIKVPNVVLGGSLAAPTGWLITRGCSLPIDLSKGSDHEILVNVGGRQGRQDFVT